MDSDGDGEAEAEADGEEGTDSASPAANGADETAAAAGSIRPTTRVHTRSELLDLLLRLCPEGPYDAEGNRTRTVGLVGYPNVGKCVRSNRILVKLESRRSWS